MIYPDDQDEFNAFVTGVKGKVPDSMAEYTMAMRLILAIERLAIVLGDRAD